MLKSLMVAALLVTTLWCVPASAQDKPRVGAVMGYPGSLGLLWRATGRVAIRPEATLQGDWSDSASVSSSGTSVSVGASMLFYLGEREGVRPYITPRFSYGRSSTTVDNALSGGGSESTTNSYLFAGSFGAQYALGRRFSLFGELGLAYSYKTSSLQVSGSTSSGPSTGTGKGVGTRTAVGVVIWF